MQIIISLCFSLFLTHTEVMQYLPQRYETKAVRLR